MIFVVWMHKQIFGGSSIPVKDCPSMESAQKYMAECAGRAFLKGISDQYTWEIREVEDESESIL